MGDITRKLGEVAPIVLEGTPVLFAYLYGSYAKGLSHPFSDLDIAIFVEELNTKAFLDLDLSLALQFDEKLDRVVQSEVRILNHLPLVIKGSIVTEGELIYSRAEERRIEFETQVRLAYFDFLPAIQQYQKAYRERVLSV